MRIAALYERLLQLTSNPVVKLNQASLLAWAITPEGGLALSISSSPITDVRVALARAALPASSAQPPESPSRGHGLETAMEVAVTGETLGQ